MHTQVNEMEFGVELTKFYEEEEYHLPSIVYEFTSKRPYPVLVRVVETVPGGIDPQHIGFHKDSARDDWKLTDDTLVFETEIAGRSEYKTVYAVYPDTEYDVEQLVTPPDKFSVEQATAVSTSHTDSDTFTRSSSSSGTAERDRGAEATPTLTIPETDEDGDPATADRADAASISDRETDFATPAADPPESGVRDEEEPPLVDQFVAELRAEEASEESLEYLAERFGAPADADKSVEVRIDQLQTDVADLRSYRNAFEDFLGEHGSPEEVVSRFEDRLDAFDSTLDSVETRVEEQEGSVTALQSEQEEIRSEIDTMTQVIWRTMQNLQELSTDVDRLDEQVTDVDVEERMAEIEDDVDEMAAVLDALKEAFRE